MADGASSSNTAIVALSILGLAVAAGVFIYFQGGFGGPDVVHEKTIIETESPAPQPKAEEPEPKAEEPGYKLEHEDSDGSKTVIETP